MEAGLHPGLVGVPRQTGTSGHCRLFSLRPKKVDMAALGPAPPSGAVLPRVSSYHSSSADNRAGAGPTSP